MTATRLLAHALATARTDFGDPIAVAISAYERVSPNGIFCNSRHTFHWNADAATSIGTSGRARLPSTAATTSVTHAPSELDGVVRRVRVAAGYSSSSAFSRLVTSSPSVTAQTPRSVAATSSATSDV